MFILVVISLSFIVVGLIIGKIEDAYEKKKRRDYLKSRLRKYRYRNGSRL